MNDAMELYREITCCPLQCDGIVNDRRKGIIPRSFYWRGHPSNVSLLIVSKNPANAPEWERNRYRQTPKDELAEVHLDFAHNVFEGVESVPSRYHYNLINRVAGVLGVGSSPASVFSHAAMTALAKCQSIGDKTARIPDETLKTCSVRYLYREIELFRPVYILALGKEVHEFLRRPDVQAYHGLQVGKLWHPSWSNMPGGEAAYFETEIPSLRDEYLKCFADRGESSR